MIDTRQGSWNPTNFRFLETETEAGGPIDPSVGGIIRRFRAAATLKCGEVVCVTAANSVNKSATTGTHSARVGVVVGGYGTGGVVMADKAVYTPATVQTAALVDQPVFVLFSGVIWVVADAAISAGGRIAPSTGTAGRVRPGLDVSGTATGLTIGAGGVAVTSSAANGAIITGTATIAGDGAGKLLGIALEAASVNGDVILAFIALA